MNLKVDSNTSQILQRDDSEGHSPQTGFTNLELLHSSESSILLKAKRDGRWWCLKCVSKEKKDDCLYIELLRKEYAIMMQIQHPCVVQAVSMENVEGYGKCIVMEYVDGSTLNSFLVKGNIRNREKQQILSQILDATQYLHSKQIVHRDLKPENILVTHNGHNVKIVDFGLSDTDAYCILKHPAGTPGYMSPEQREVHLADIRNDIYSIGVIMRDMQIGWIYKPIVKRCLSLVHLRYSNIEQLKHSIRFWRLLYRVLLIGGLTVAIALCAVIGLREPLDNHPQPQVLTQEAEIIKTAQDSIQIVVEKTPHVATRSNSHTTIRENNLENITHKALQELQERLSLPEYEFSPSKMSHNDFIFARRSAEIIIEEILAQYESKLSKEEYEQLESSVREEFFTICNERYYGKQ